MPAPVLARRWRHGLAALAVALLTAGPALPSVRAAAEPPGPALPAGDEEVDIVVPDTIRPAPPPEREAAVDAAVSVLTFGFADLLDGFRAVLD